MPSGTYITSSPLTFNTPGTSRLAFRSSYNGRKLTSSLNVYINDSTYTPSYGDPSQRHISVHLGGADKLFICSGIAICSPTIENDGSTLTKETAKRFVYREKDGTIYTFYDEIVQTIPGSCTDELSTCNAAGYLSDAGISTIEYPNGEKLTFSPLPIAQTINGVCYASDIITSNLGYSLSISFSAVCNYTAPANMVTGSEWVYYEYNGIGSRRVTLFYGSTILGTLTNSQTTSGSDTTVTQQDDIGRSFQMILHVDPETMCPDTQDYTYLKPTVVITPGGVRTDISYYNMYIANPHGQGTDSVPVKTVTRGGRTWSYDMRTGGKTVTTPMGPTQSVTTVDYTAYSYGNLQAGPCPVGRTGYRVMQETDGLNRSISYTYDGRFVTKVTFAEGNAVVYGYDSRHNLTTITNKSKPGSGIADIISYQANYDTTCSNMKKCNQPNWTQDGNNNRTDYTYDLTHGGILTSTLPADQNGLRLRTFNTYTAFNTGSNLIYRITRSETCGLNSGQLGLSSCPALSTTSVTTTSYGDGSSAPYTYKSFLPYSITKTDGAGTLSVSAIYSYDTAGRVIAVDGPRTDVNDIVYTTYDAVGRKIFEVGADPDGSGPLPRKIIKHTYDNDDHEIRKDVGYGNSTTGSDFVSAGFTRNSYDPATGLLIKTEQVLP